MVFGVAQEKNVSIYFYDGMIMFLCIWEKKSSINIEARHLGTVMESCELHVTAINQGFIYLFLSNCTFLSTFFSL